MDLFTSLVQLLQTDATDAAVSLSKDDLTQEVRPEEETLFADGEKAKLGGNSYCVVV
jgi:hypothetical protein